MAREALRAPHATVTAVKTVPVALSRTPGIRTRTGPISAAAAPRALGGIEGAEPGMKVFNMPSLLWLAGHWCSRLAGDCLPCRPYLAPAVTSPTPSHQWGPSTRLCPHQRTSRGLAGAVRLPVRCRQQLLLRRAGAPQLSRPLAISSGRCQRQAGSQRHAQPPGGRSALRQAWCVPVLAGWQRGSTTQTRDLKRALPRALPRALLSRTEGVRTRRMVMALQLKRGLAGSDLEPLQLMRG